MRRIQSSRNPCHVLAALAVLGMLALPALAHAQGTLSPFGITRGPDGNVWFTEATGNAIGRITPSTGSQQSYPLPTAGSDPLFITAGADGNVWFTEYGTATIGRITPHSVVTEFTI